MRVSSRRTPGRARCSGQADRVSEVQRGVLEGVGLGVRGVEAGRDAVFAAVAETVPHVWLVEQMSAAARRWRVAPSGVADDVEWLTREAADAAGVRNLAPAGRGAAVTGVHLRLFVAYLLERGSGDWAAHGRNDWLDERRRDWRGSEMLAHAAARQAIAAALREPDGDFGQYAGALPDVISYLLDVPVQVLGRDGNWRELERVDRDPDQDERFYAIVHADLGYLATEPRPRAEGQPDADDHLPRDEWAWRAANQWWTGLSGPRTRVNLSTGRDNVYAPNGDQRAFLRGNGLEVRWVTPDGDCNFAVVTELVPQDVIRAQIVAAARRAGIELPDDQDAAVSMLLDHARDAAARVAGSAQDSARYAALPLVERGDWVSGQHLRVALAYLLERGGFGGWIRTVDGFFGSDQPGDTQPGGDVRTRRGLIAALRRLGDYGRPYGDVFSELIGYYLDLPLRVLDEYGAATPMVRQNAGLVRDPDTIVNIHDHYLAAIPRSDAPRRSAQGPAPAHDEQSPTGPGEPSARRDSDSDDGARPSAPMQREVRWTQLVEQTVIGQGHRGQDEGHAGVLSQRLEGNVAGLMGRVIRWPGLEHVRGGSVQAETEGLTAVLAEATGQAGDGRGSAPWDSLVSQGLALLELFPRPAFAGSLPGVDPDTLRQGSSFTVDGLIRAHADADRVTGDVVYQIHDSIHGRDASSLAGADLIMFDRGQRFQVTADTTDELGLRRITLTHPGRSAADTGDVETIETGSLPSATADTPPAAGDIEQPAVAAPPAVAPPARAVQWAQATLSGIADVAGPVPAGGGEPAGELRSVIAAVRGTGNALAAASRRPRALPPPGNSSARRSMTWIT